MEQLVIHNLVQGRPEWHKFRLDHDGASEAAAMLGLSKKTTRTELLRMKSTGIAKEFSDWLQKNVLDKGHEVEELARPLIEEIIGDDLYPVTCSRGRLSASLDGRTMSGAIVLEHKQWNEALAESVRNGVLPEEHQPQCQQINMVAEPQKLIFVVSDGTAENMVLMVVPPDPVWFDRLAKSWEQFHLDLETFEPAPAAPTVVAEPVQALPAVLVQVTGEIAVKDNFKVFETALRDFIENRLIREPKTDQDFADLDLQIKAMKGAEDALAGAEAQMLAQVQSIDQAKKTKDMLAKLVRDNRLMAEKLLASEKERRRGEIVADGVAKFKAHLDGLNKRLGKPYMPSMSDKGWVDFGGVIKGMKSMASMENAVATELARAKIEANEVADRLQANLDYLREHAKDYTFLFADTAQIIQKALDDLQALVQNRITTHKADEARKEEETRERIRREEQDRIAREAAAQVAQAAPPAQPAVLPAAVTAILPTGGPREAMGGTVRMFPDAAPRAPASPPTLKFGQIGERLGFVISADFLASLGFPPAATDKNAKLFHEADFPRICAALIQHINSVQIQVAA